MNTLNTSQKPLTVNQSARTMMTVSFSHIIMRKEESNGATAFSMPTATSLMTVSVASLQDPGALQQTSCWSPSSLSSRKMEALVKPQAGNVTASVDQSSQIWMIAATLIYIRISIFDI